MITKQTLNVDISIIVPVYNVEKYIYRCLDSIFSQHFCGTFEVIAVEDGSTDNSLQMLKSYQENESRLKIIEHENNKKLSVARSNGMKASSGNYIMHVDSDDWLLPDSLEKLFSKCKETDADVVVFNYLRENSKGERTLNRKIKKNLITTDKLQVQKYFFGATVNKIVKRKLILDMICGRVGVNTTEDLLYATEILFRAEKICLISEFYYVYFVNTESLTHTIKSEQFLQNQIIILSQLQNIVSEYNADSMLIRNISNYFENRIYLEFAKSHIYNRGENDNNNKLIREFSNYPILNKSRIKRLELSIKSYIICLLEVIYRFGLKTTIGIFRRRFNK